MSRPTFAALVLALLTATACGESPAPGPAPSDSSKPTPEAGPPAEAAAAQGLVDTLPAGEAGLRSLLEALLADVDGRADLSLTLRPTSRDFSTLLRGEAATRAEAAYAPGWDGGALVLDPGDEARTEIRILGVTTDDISAWRGTAAEEFPGGWRKAGAHLQPGHTIFQVEFLEPGKDAGMRFDGFVHLNGHWCIFPKLWRFLGE